MADNKLSVELTGDNTSLMSALDKAANHINTFAKDGKKDITGMDGAFDKLSGAFNMIKGAIAGLAIFEVFKVSVDAAIDLGKEVRRLSSYFQISSDKAGELAEALKRMGSSPDEFISMTDKIAKELKKSTEAYDRYGIKVKQIGADGKEHWRPQLDVMEDVGKKLNSIEGATARNIAAQELLGRGGKESATYLMKLAAAAKASEENLKEMGVSIDYEGLKTKSKEYAKSQADISQGFNVMKVIVVQELLPSLTELMKFFSGIMGPVVQGVSWIIKGLTTGFYTLKFAIEDIVCAISDFALKTWASVSGVGKAIWALMKGDLAGAKKEMEDGNAEYQRIDKETHQVYVDNAEVYGDKLLKIWGDGLEKKKVMEEEADGGKVSTKDDREKDQVVLDALKKRLEDHRRFKAYELGIDEEYYQLSIRETLDFWKKQSSSNAKAQSFINHEVTALKKTALAEDYNIHKAVLATQLEASKGDYAAQLSLANAFLGTLTKNQVKERQEALKQIQTIKNAAKDADKKYEEEVLSGERQHNKAMMAIQVEEVANKKALGIISETEAINRIKMYDALELSQEKKILAEKLLLAQNDKVARQKILNEITALEDKQNEKIRKDNAALYLELRKKNPMAGLRDGAKDYVKAAQDHFANFKNYAVRVLNATETGISDSLKGMITGQQKFGEAMKGIWNSITGAVLDCLTQMAAKWLVAAIAQQVFGAATKVTSNVEAGAALDVASAQSYAAYAGMPYIGVPLAIAQIATIMAGFSASKAANAAVTAFAVGGRVDRPTMGMIGEAGETEYIVPDRDMKSLLPSLVAQGAAMYGAIVKSQSRVNRYAAGPSSAPTPVQANRGQESRSIPAVVQFPGATIFTSNSTEMQNFLAKANYGYQGRKS